MSATRKNPKEEFKQLLTRKQMLQEVLGVADRIEQLHSGLSSAMQMGKQTSHINKNLLQDNREIDAFRSLPPHRLKEVLAKLEARMIDSIQR
ncbi:MAG: hypothetical protein HQL47_03745, partial [Gammaproteobacteria bacterium]|nr:hypothetical protein [Gammaproteobacteria bacterium]